MFMIDSQLATLVFYGILWETIHINSENEKIDIHTDFDSMRKTFYILSLIILSLLSLETTVQAQTKQNAENASFDLNPDGSYSGEFRNIIDDTNPSQEYFFSKINGTKRVDDKTLMIIRRNGYITYPIRIEVDKGQISCGVLVQGIFHMKNENFVKKTEGKIKEDKIIESTTLHSWIVSDLDKNDKHFTIKIYLEKSNLLIAEKTFFIKDAIPAYYPQLTYTDLNGNEHTVSKSVKLKDISINYNIPIKLSVYGFGNKTYKVISFGLDNSKRMGNTIYEHNMDDVFTDKQMAWLRRYSQSNNNIDLYWISDIFYVDSDGKGRLTKKPFIIYR